MADQTIPSIKNLRGKIGIGLISPSTPLHVKGNIRAEASGSTAFADFKSSQIYASGTYDIIVGTNNSLYFRTNDERRMTILNDGKVGIGTTMPSVQLDIEGSSNVIADLNTMTANANTTIRFQENGSVKATIGYDGTNDGLILTTGGFTAGNGIFIDDNQDVSFSGNVVISGGLTVQGTTTTINSTTVSVDDKNIELGSVATPTDLTADGGGITLKGAEDYTINWSNSTDSWHFNQGITVGVDDTGHDVKFFGATAGRYLLWDESANALTGVYDLKVADNREIQLGGSNDLRLYHSHPNNYIKANSGDLIIQSDNDDLKILAEDDIVLRDNDDSTNFIHCVNGGAVKLYHNGSQKFETSSSGASITGQLTTSGNLTVNGESNLEAVRVDGTLTGGDSSIYPLLTGFVTPQNPEGAHIKNPYFFNDLAYARLRGATVTVTVTGGSSPNNTDIDRMLDASTYFWNLSTSGVSEVVITIENLPKNFTHTTHMGITFGNTVWRAKNVKLESYYNGQFNTLREVTDQADEYVHVQTNTSNNAQTKLRWTLSNFNTTSMRIASIYCYNYNANGMSDLYVTRDGGNVYGNIAFQDAKYATFGGGADLSIGHDGSNSYISENGTGDIFLESNNSNIYLRDSNGGNVMIAAKGGSGEKVELYYGGDKKLETTNIGVHIDDYLSTEHINMSGELNFTGNGSKFIDVFTLADSNSFKIRHHNPTGNLFETAFESAANGATTLYYDGATRFATTTNGIQLYGDGYVDLPDDGRVRFGTSDDLEIYHDSSNNNNYIQANNGRNLFIESNGLSLRSQTGENMITATGDGAVSLYHNNSKKLETNSAGVTVTGKLSATEVAVTNIVTNKLVKFNGMLLDDSIISDDASTVTVGGDLTVSGQISSDAFGPWYSTSNYVYDSTNGVRYFWNLLGTMPAATGKGSIEYEAKDDENYPHFVKGTIAFGSFTGGGGYTFSVQHDQQTADYFNVQVRVDTSRRIWIRIPNCDWSHFFRFRVHDNAGTFTTNTSWSTGTTRYDTHTTAVPPNSSSDILSGQNLRATNTSVTGSVPTYDQSHNFGRILARNRITSGDGTAGATAYGFNNGTNTGMYLNDYTSSPQKDQLNFSVDGSRRLRINEAGTFVDGNSYVANGAQFRTFQEWLATTGGNGYGFKFLNNYNGNSSAALTISAVGNTVAGGSVTGTSATFGTLELHTAGNINYISSQDASKDLVIRNTGSGKDMVLQVASSNGIAEVLRLRGIVAKEIVASGNFEVRNGSSARHIYLYETYTDSSNYERSFFKHASSFLEIGTEGLGSGAQTASGLKLKTAGADRVTVLSGGNVGINNTSPTEKLDVVGLIKFGNTRSNNTQKIGRLLVPEYNNSHGSFLAFMGTGNSSTNFVSFGGGTGSADAATDLAFYTASAVNTHTGTERMRIASDGNVGIGTQTPDAKLQVEGLIKQQVITVSQLPTPSSTMQGVRAFVSDSSMSASGNFGSTIQGYGGGSNTVPVWCDGNYWYIG